MTLATALAMSAHVGAHEAVRNWPLPMATTPPPAIQAPRDIPFPGTLRLEVDATDAMRGINRIHETVPVTGPRHLTLLFPQWIPGDPVPPNALDRMAGLVMHAGGKSLKWRRDPVEQAAFHVDVPAGAKAVEVDFQFLVPSKEEIAPVLSTPTMMDLQWQSHVLYPAGYYARRIRIEPSLTLPKDWQFASSLDGARRVGDVVRFAPVALDTLVDSPVMGARWMKQYSLSEDPVPVRLDIAADTEQGLEIPQDTLDQYRRAVAQAYKLFGGRHYDHYDMMVWVSNDFGPSYFEQGRSGETAVPTAFFSDRKRYARFAGAPFHGFVHAWNGVFRMPAEMWTANLNTPPQDSMLWVFEGLTVYWDGVLAARSGLVSHEDSLLAWESNASAFANRPGLQWRSLQDASNEVLIQHGNGIIYPDARRQSWPDWQLNTNDPYIHGALVWLDIDTLIRQRSGGARSLDDFARGFFGIRDGSLVAAPYTFDDIVAALNAVMPYDWSAFLRARVDSVGIASDLDGITRGGYRLVWNEQPSAAQQQRETRTGEANLRHSVGMTLDKDGAVTEVAWESPAWRAGLVIGAKILSINGQAYSAAALKEAIAAAHADTPIKLKVSRGQTEHLLSLASDAGLRYPHLERIPDAAAWLDDILKPRT